MGEALSRLIPVFLILGFAIFLGCMETEAVAPEEDPFGPKLEALNGEIYSSATQAEVARLTAEVTALESNISASGQYPDYLILTQAQLLTLEVLDASLLHKQETSLIAASGIDCSKDYTDITSTLAMMNYTKNSATTKANSYLAKDPDSTADLLLRVLDDIDTNGMYLFTELLEGERAYLCPETQEPAKSYVTPLTESEAVRLVVDEVMGTEDYVVYSVGEPLEAGTVVSVESPAGDLTDRTMDSETWLFMLDSTPLASFSHPVKFVYVDVATADYYVTDEVFNPVIDGIHYWPSLDDRTDPEWVVYPEDPVFDLNESNASLSSFRRYSDGRLYFFPLAIANVPVGTPCDSIDCCEGVGEDKALIVNGNDQDLFHTDTKNMYDFLKGEGMSAGDITYLTAKAGVSESDGVTTLASFKKAIEDLAKDTECCDRVFIYITGHGTNVTYYEFKEKATGKKTRYTRAAALKLDFSKWEYTGDAYAYHRINMNPYKEKAKPGGGTVSEGSKDGGRMWAEDIAALLDKLDSCYVTVMYDSCHSGYAAPWLAGKGRTIMTTSDKGSSYAYPRSKKTGKSAGGIWNTLWIMAHNTFKDEADKNNDGDVDHQEAYDYANKYAPGVVKAHAKKDQKGTVTPPEPPCECCDVICNEDSGYLCIIIEGNGTIDPQCKKVGDYCGPTTTDGIPPEDGDGVTVGNGELPPEEPTEPSVCGDGNITGAEQCDHGSPSTNKCEEGKYCKECMCHDLETSIVCGDGKISSPQEDCDGGNVLYNVCPEGQTCQICQCVGEQAQCGDGRITPPEECDHGNSYTAQCPGGNTCYSCQCIPPGDVPEETHLECVDSACITVPGLGTDECSTSADCEEEAECGDGDVEGNEQCEYDYQCGTDEYCSNCQCVPEGGPVCGNDEVEEGEECEDDGDCSGNDICVGCQCISPEPYCGDEEVNGDEECDPTATPDGCDESGVCGSLCRCVYPPSLNCELVCAATPGAQSFGGGYGSANECKNAVADHYGTTTCYLTCSYSWYYKVTNIAGEASCCCGVKKMFECSDCPGQNPQCPDPDTTCAANAPSWVPPS